MKTPAPYDTDANLSPKIEAFAEYRDHIFRSFRISRKNILKLAVVCGVIPMFLFAKIKDSQVSFVDSKVN